MAPASEYTIERTWSVRGLQATASHDVVLGPWCFPEEWTLPFPFVPTVDVPFAHMCLGAWPASYACAAVQLGLASAALEVAVDEAHRKRRPGDRTTAFEQTLFHTEWARARGRYDAALAGVERALEDAWSRAVTGVDITIEQRMALRVTSAHAVREAADVVRSAAMLVGADSVYRRHRMERLFRDAHVLIHHVSVSDRTMEAVSRVGHGLLADDGLT